MRRVQFGDVNSPGGVAQALRQIEGASEVDAMSIADAYTVTGYTPTRSLDMSSATAAQIGAFIATFLADLKNRGPYGSGV